MSRLIDITGNVYNLLTVLKRDGVNSVGQTKWKCKCVCGNEPTITGRDLKSGHTASCGCYKKSSNLVRSVTHGKSKTSEYKSWVLMKNRCCNAKADKWEYYGGRGIVVCDRWLNCFEKFLLDMGEKPSLSHSLDRINNEGNYEPSNCRWATKKEQSNNRRVRIDSVKNKIK